jgi:hypothetical protein
MLACVTAGWLSRQLLGVQDASRKWKAPAIKAVAWQGAVVWTHNECIQLSVLPERREKCKAIIQWLVEQVATNLEKILHHTLECYHGFLIYISRTYLFYYGSLSKGDPLNLRWMEG